MVIVDQDEGGGSGAEVGSMAAQPVLVNVRPPARLIERATAECAGRVELPSSITTNGAQVALADAQPADGGGDHELARAVVLRLARAEPSPRHHRSPTSSRAITWLCSASVMCQNRCWPSAQPASPTAAWPRSTRPGGRVRPGSRRCVGPALVGVGWRGSRRRRQRRGHGASVEQPSQGGETRCASPP